MKKWKGKLNTLTLQCPCLQTHHSKGHHGNFLHFITIFTKCNLLFKRLFTAGCVEPRSFHQPHHSQGLFTTDDWKEQARVLQQIPNLVVGWCHLHSFVYHHGKKGRETILASCPSAVSNHSHSALWNNCSPRLFIQEVVWINSFVT